MSNNMNTPVKALKEFEKIIRGVVIRTSRRADISNIIHNDHIAKLRSIWNILQCVAFANPEKLNDDPEYLESICHPLGVSIPRLRMKAGYDVLNSSIPGVVINNYGSTKLEISVPAAIFDSIMLIEALYNLYNGVQLERGTARRRLEFSQRLIAALSALNPELYKAVSDMFLEHIIEISGGIRDITVWKESEVGQRVEYINSGTVVINMDDSNESEGKRLLSYTEILKLSKDFTVKILETIKMPLSIYLISVIGKEEYSMNATLEVLEATLKRSVLVTNDGSVLNILPDSRNNMLSITPYDVLESIAANKPVITNLTVMVNGERHEIIALKDSDIARICAGDINSSEIAQAVQEAALRNTVSEPSDSPTEVQYENGTRMVRNGVMCIYRRIGDYGMWMPANANEQIAEITNRTNGVVHDGTNPLTATRAVDDDEYPDEEGEDPDDDDEVTDWNSPEDEDAEEDDEEDYEDEETTAPPEPARGGHFVINPDGTVTFVM